MSLPTSIALLTSGDYGAQFLDRGDYRLRPYAGNVMAAVRHDDAFSARRESRQAQLEIVHPNLLISLQIGLGEALVRMASEFAPAVRTISGLSAM